jgi:putative endonuclease
MGIRGSDSIATTRDAGALWEDAALQYLKRHGLELVTRNFTCRFGELDLVLRDRGHLVFAEVRFRGDAARGDGTVSVGPAKRKKLARAASLYLQAHPQYSALPCRFDVIGCGGSLAQPVFEWTRGAFEAF